MADHVTAHTEPTNPTPAATELDLNSQLKSDFGFTYNDRDYILMKLEQGDLLEKKGIVTNQYQSQLMEILNIVDQNKNHVPKNCNEFQIQSIISDGDDLDSCLKELELKFDQLKNSDESLQIVSKSSTESEMKSDNGDEIDNGDHKGKGKGNTGDEIWKQGYLFLKRISK